MMPLRDANIAELQPEQDAQRDTAAAIDWSGWERWLYGHLNKALGNLHAALGQLLAAERRKFADQLERKTHALELELACAGGTYQAQRDTARAPGSADWTCLAAADAGFAVRGKYLAAAIEQSEWLQ